MSEAATHAFGAPGIAPTWSSSDKDFVTAALDGSRLWASIGHGIFNEVYRMSTGIRSMVRVSAARGLSWRAGPAGRVARLGRAALRSSSARS